MVRAIAWACWLAGSLLAGESGVSIADFEGANPLAGWTVSKDPEFPSAEGSLALGPGHSGRGAVFEYRFRCAGARCGGSAAAMWTPPKPVPFKHKGAVSMWIRATAGAKLTLLVRDPNEGTHRYPFEVTTLEHPDGGNWRQVVIPLAAKSTGYWDDDHNGPPKGRMASIGILAEARYPMAMNGSVSFDDLELLESPDRSFTLGAAMPLDPAPPASAKLAPRLGVNIHTLSDENLLDQVQDAGFTFVRADLLWAQAERNGRYRFGAYDRLLNALEKHGMGALWILDYGHPQHGGDPPRTRDDVTAFARYAEATAAHFKGRNVRYEVWNEPDVERFWPPRPNPVEYSALLREAAAAIHRADPAARVASGGLARIDLPFLQAVIAAGGAGDMNAAGVHPYRRLAPETLAAELPLLSQLMATAGGANLEIWDTEWGYASYDYFSKNLRGDGHSAAGLDRQAVLACREALAVWALGLPVAVWYDLRDDGGDPRNPEHNYGLLDANGAAKPAMKALRVLAQVAREHTYAGTIRDVPDGAHAMLLESSADQVCVVWSEQPDARITLRVPLEGIVSATNLMGEPVKWKNAHGEAEIALVETAGPVYVRRIRL